MKKVLQHGYDKFATTCKKCGCYFAYELSDIALHHFIECPECSYDNRREFSDLSPAGQWEIFMSDNWTVKDYPIK